MHPAAHISKNSATLAWQHNIMVWSNDFWIPMIWIIEMLRLARLF